MLRGATAASLLDAGLFGADSIATRSANGGSLLFFATCCCALTSPAARLSPEACEFGVGVKLNGIAGAFLALTHTLDRDDQKKLELRGATHEHADAREQSCERSCTR